jgi:hypothetical protein
MKTCPKCSSQNEANKKFCDSCGTSLASEVEQLLEVHGLSNLHRILKDNDLLTAEALKSVSDSDLEELNLPSYGDKIRFKKLLDSLKPEKAPPEKKPEDPKPVKEVAVAAPEVLNLAEESKKLLRQAALQGINKAAQLIASSPQDAPATVQSAPPPVPRTNVEDDQSLIQKINRGYLFMLWSWLTYGILGLAAWFFAYKNGKSSRNEILSQHCRLQIKLSSVGAGVWFLGSFVAGIIDKPAFYQVYGIALLLTWGWYMVGAWKGRKALKEGRSPL